MPLLNLPEPASWPTSGRRLTRLTWSIIGFVGVGMFFGVRNMLFGNGLSAFVVLGWQVPFILILIALKRVARGRSSLSIKSDLSGTTLQADRTFSALLLLAFAAFIPVGIFYSIFTLAGDLEMFDSPGSRIVSLALTAGATVTAGAGLLSAWRRGGVGSVNVTPSGLDVANIVSNDFTPWDSVENIADHSTSNKKTRKAVVLSLRDGTEKVIDGADFYVPKGVGLYWMIQHYWRNLDDRPELVDGRAIERLRDGRFDVDQAQA